MTYLDYKIEVEDNFLDDKDFEELNNFKIALKLL